MFALDKQSWIERPIGMISPNIDVNARRRRYIEPLIAFVVRQDDSLPWKPEGRHIYYLPAASGNAGALQAIAYVSVAMRDHTESSVDYDIHGAACRRWVSGHMRSNQTVWNNSSCVEWLHLYISPSSHVGDVATRLLGIEGCGSVYGTCVCLNCHSE